jgi:hypothetical protein
MGIVELHKPGGARCPNQLSAGGCAIYGAHPPSCRDFSCQWLLVPEMPHRYRPDLTKVVLATDDDGERLIAHCDPSNPLAWKREPIYSLLKRKARSTWGSGFCVLAKAGQRIWLVGRDRDEDLGEIDPLSPVSIVQLPDGTAHVTILPPVTPQVAADSGMSPVVRGA